MMYPRLSILVAMSKNRVIGRNNALPWHLPADLRLFKSLTMGRCIVMGRKTYESISKPLPGRINIVMTHQKDYKIPGVIVVNCLEDALLMCQQHDSIHQENFIIGGEKIFQQTLNICQRMYITEIQKEMEGDTFFPAFDRYHWQEKQRDIHFSDGEHSLEYHFVILDRKG